MTIKRCTYGSGSVTTYKGKYVARYRVHGVIKKKTFNKRSEAENWLKDIKGLEPVDYTVGNWLVKYITDYKLPVLRPRSLERVKQAALHLQPLYNIPLQELKPNDIQVCINGLKLSASSIKKSCDLLKSSLKQAVAERLIASNPAEAITRPPVKKKPKINIFTRREVGKIFRAVRKLQNNKYNNSQRYNFTLLFRLLLTTGVRVSELLALTWDNVDTELHTITIEGSKDIDGQEIHKPKTESGVRTVPLLSVKTRNLLYRYKDTGFVFKTRSGGAMSYQRVYLTWNNIRKLTGITKSIHTFRHTCISYMLTYGNIPIAQVAAIAGHSSAAVTLSIYTHAIQEYTIKKYTSNGDTFGDTSNKTKRNKKPPT